jgi:hypothetical protein
MHHRHCAGDTRWCVGYTLPYPSNNFAIEFTFIWLFLVIEPIRVFLGTCSLQSSQWISDLADVLLCRVQGELVWQ